MNKLNKKGWIEFNQEYCSKKNLSSYVGSDLNKSEVVLGFYRWATGEIIEYNVSQFNNPSIVIKEFLEKLVSSIPGLERIDLYSEHQIKQQGTQVLFREGYLLVGSGVVLDVKEIDGKVKNFNVLSGKESYDGYIKGVEKDYLTRISEKSAEDKKTSRVVERLKMDTMFNRVISTPINLGTNMEIELSETYNHDLPEDRIQKCIKVDRGGIFIFHGEPGTGKSTYIKHLIQSNPGVNFVVVDSMILSSYQDKFSEYLMGHFGESKIYVLEDCEKFIQDRSKGTGNYYMGLADILNLSDGLLGDAVKAKFLCTFNTDLTNVDEALLRPGRLFVEYEFKKLSEDLTRSLKAKHGVSDPRKQMTVAEILCWEPAGNSAGEHQKKIGF